MVFPTKCSIPAIATAVITVAVITRSSRRDVVTMLLQPLSAMLVALRQPLTIPHGIHKIIKYVLYGTAIVYGVGTCHVYEKVIPRSQ